MDQENNNQEEPKNNPFAKNGEEETVETTEENQEEETTKEPSKTVEKEKYDELNNQYIRLAADFDNYRKRQVIEREALLKYGAEDIMKKLLPVLDTFDRANQANENVEECKKLKESVDVIYKQLTDALEKAGLKKIETIGKEFDPNMHEAVMQTTSEELPDQSVMAELQCGYILEDKVLRAAMVNVAVSG